MHDLSKIHLVFITHVSSQAPKTLGQQCLVLSKIHENVYIVWNNKTVYYPDYKQGFPKNPSYNALL